LLLLIVTYIPPGTPGYIAPESITYHTYSAKTDLWQAGCTLYSLLSGLLPYGRDDYEQVTHHK
jgi:serine/threonine protein kinase